MEQQRFWHLPILEVFHQLKSRREGLTIHEARARLKVYGHNSLKPPKRGKGIILFLSQFSSPLILLLIGAALLSYFLGGRTDSVIIFSIVVLSGLLGFIQERGALNALEELMQLVENKTSILRNGSEHELSMAQLVPGDLVVLRAGDLVPADCMIVESKHCFVDEAMLTGESAPVEKNESATSLDTPDLKRENALFYGTTVASGMAVAIVVATGRNTQFSSIAERIRFRPPETAFEVGVRNFGYFLLEVTLILVIVIFAFNIFFKRPIIDSFLFSLALAVGLTPQLLPAIIMINLSHGARRMAKKNVVIKRLASIENFGQMDILCTDKTGTITQGKMQLSKAVVHDGTDSDRVAYYGFLNAHFQGGYKNPIDQALLKISGNNLDRWRKLDEVPYDFIRKRLSVLLEIDGRKVLICKGAVPNVLSVCDRIELPDGSIVSINASTDQIKTYFEEQSKQGFRTLAVAYGDNEQEANLVFLGFLHFFDALKSDVAEAVVELKSKGIQLKIITGDHQSVAMHVAESLKLPHLKLVTGSDLHKITGHALMKIVRECNVFAEIEPNQKEIIILALRKSGHVVGFLGDGINDVSALHSADVGISVHSAADTAKEAADIVLLQRDLSVLCEGVEEGRRTFANTIKYVYMATSANFGNMFSMAGASLFLSFLPLLPKQILLTNLISDFPEVALASDNVDKDTVAHPVKWNLHFIRRFMLVFGCISSVADYLTFAVLIYVCKADETFFRTGWFIESVVSAALIALIIRTKKPFWRSKPSLYLFIAVVSVVLIAPLIPLSPLGGLFNFAPLPFYFYPYLLGILVFYIASVEIGKHFFFKNHKK